MKHFDKDLKMFSENGLRSATEWLSYGRQVQDGTKPRASVDTRRQVVELFSRDQTKRSERPGRDT